MIIMKVTLVDENSTEITADSLTKRPPFPGMEMADNLDAIFRPERDREAIEADIAATDKAINNLQKEHEDNRRIWRVLKAFEKSWEDLVAIFDEGKAEMIIYRIKSVIDPTGKTRSIKHFRVIQSKIAKRFQTALAERKDLENELNPIDLPQMPLGTAKIPPNGMVQAAFDEAFNYFVTTLGDKDVDTLKRKSV